MNYFDSAIKIFNNIEFVKTLKINLLEITGNTALCEFTAEEHHANYIKGLHGGVVAGVVDTIAFFPGRLLPSGVKLTTSGFDIKFFRPAKIGDKLNAKAEILYLGRRRSTVDVKVFFNENSKILAQATVDLMVLI
jgi:acyl-CoA thioesterase